MRFCLLLSLFFLHNGCFSQRINRYRHQEKHGKWLVYQDSAKTRIDNIGRYRKGDQKGLWKFYDEDGKLIKTELYRFRRISTAYYHPNGKLRKKGVARQVDEGLIIHYYYDGYWLLYDTTGTLIKKQKYHRGNRIAEIDVASGKESTVNDPLVSMLQLIEREIQASYMSVVDALRSKGKDSDEYRREMGLYNLQATLYLGKLDSLIAFHGYPGKTLAGEDYSLAFSIISSASLPYKEKYYNLIINAANTNQLDWKDVAFFVDKVKVAKKEKQVYCTQYKIDEAQDIFLYYPTEDLAKVNERRLKAGLWELTIEELRFTEY